MSPTIRIDDEVFDELKSHAEPFVDTPNSVLRRILGLSEAAAVLAGETEVGEEPTPGRAEAKRGRQRRRRTKATRAPRATSGTILPESEYEVPMLEIISKHGGRAAAREVLAELEARLDGQLTEVDRQELASGNIRWRNRAQFVRLRLIEQGDMVKNSPRGMWEITDQGRRRIGAKAAA